MFNSAILKFITLCCLTLFLGCFFSCKDEVILDFAETNIVDEGETIIEINIPKAKGSSEAAKQINTTLNHFVNTALNIEGYKEPKSSTEESIADFKTSYNDFKTQIGKTLYTELPPWEVVIDGEIIYKNQSLACVAMSSSINTGGAHSNLIFRFYNFDTKTGRELQTNDLINDIPAFTTLAKKYFDKELLSAEDNRIKAFETNTFKLPEHLGFSEDGVIVFYDTFNSALNNIIEFTIPYTAANNYLNF
ncbi:PdaC/SigV domain-containing protein [Lacinutrix chionoecetis]